MSFDTHVSPEIIKQQIQRIRRQNVMLDRDLAELYGVTTAALNQAVKRNAARFPKDFMFQLSREEFNNWKSHYVITNPGLKMGARRRPLAFTEQGVAMLSGILKSQRAIQVNITIMRTFVTLRRLLATHEELAHKLVKLEQEYDEKFRAVFDAIRQLMASPASDHIHRQIGFSTDDE